MIEILIGNIASGKSSYCYKRAKEGAVIVSDDAIVNMLHGNEYTLYNKRLKPLYKAIENQTVMSAAQLNLDIVIDRANNVSSKSRKRFIGLAHSLDIEVKALVFPLYVLETHAKRRFDSDNRGYTYEDWLKVANRIDVIYDYPKLEEGFTEILLI